MSVTATASFEAQDGHEQNLVDALRESIPPFMANLGVCCLPCTQRITAP